MTKTIANTANTARHTYKAWGKDTFQVIESNERPFAAYSYPVDFQGVTAICTGVVFAADRPGGETYKFVTSIKYLGIDIIPLLSSTGGLQANELYEVAYNVDFEKAGKATDAAVFAISGETTLLMDNESVGVEFTLFYLPTAEQKLFYPYLTKLIKAGTDLLAPYFAGETISGESLLLHDRVFDIIEGEPEKYINCPLPTLPDLVDLNERYGADIIAALRAAHTSPSALAHFHTALVFTMRFGFKGDIKEKPLSENDLYLLSECQYYVSKIFRSASLVNWHNASAPAQVSDMLLDVGEAFYNSPELLNTVERAFLTYMSYHHICGGHLMDWLIDEFLTARDSIISYVAIYRAKIIDNQ